MYISLPITVAEKYWTWKIWTRWVPRSRKRLGILVRPITISKHVLSLLLLMEPNNSQKSNWYAVGLDYWDFKIENVSRSWENKTCKQFDAGARTEKCTQVSCQTRGYWKFHPVSVSFFNVFYCADRNKDANNSF